MSFRSFLATALVFLGFSLTTTQAFVLAQTTNLIVVTNAETGRLSTNHYFAKTSPACYLGKSAPSNKSLPIRIKAIVRRAVVELKNWFAFAKQDRNGDLQMAALVVGVLLAFPAAHFMVKLIDRPKRLKSDQTMPAQHQT